MMTSEINYADVDQWSREFIKFPFQTREIYTRESEQEEDHHRASSINFTQLQVHRSRGGLHIGECILIFDDDFDKHSG